MDHGGMTQARWLSIILVGVGLGGWLSWVVGWSGGGDGDGGIVM